MASITSIKRGTRFGPEKKSSLKGSEGQFWTSLQPTLGLRVVASDPSKGLGGGTFDFFS